MIRSDIIRIVTVTSLYPSAEAPNFGVFVENRLRHLVAAGGVTARVVAPVPWFPGLVLISGDYARWARVPARETRHGLEILHPRFLNIPKIGMMAAPYLMARAIGRALKKLRREGYDFDLIDAHYFYPDGVAAVMAGESLGKPVVVTARGSDINLIAENFAGPRRLIRWAAGKAKGLITVSEALAEKLTGIGIDRARIRVLKNGVDLGLFAFQDQAMARRKLGFEGTILLSVGNLVPLKGHDLTIRALKLMPEARLLIAGSGPEEAALKTLARGEGVACRVTFLGRVPHHDLPLYYGAADALVLASSREGMANVLLESLACGTPVVASPIPGMDEVIGPPESGRLMAGRTPEALAEAVKDVLAHRPDRALTRRYAESFNWDETTAGQVKLFQEILGRV